jgi:hypothetical protein
MAYSYHFVRLVFQVASSAKVLLIFLMPPACASLPNHNNIYVLTRSTDYPELSRLISSTSLVHHFESPYITLTPRTFFSQILTT